MEQNWNLAQDLEHFRHIWGYRSPEHNVQHTREIWNERAHEWARQLQGGERRERSDKRVQATAAYLRSRGLLTPDSDVIDIGCGPGRFVAEFAKTARHAVGTDLSGQMLEYGAQYAREIGVENTSYVEADFQQADLDALGWRNRFDLVFSSITPAIGGDGLKKLMEISRGWCFNSCFVRFEDELEDELVRNVLNREPKRTPNGHWHWFYALFNLLLLEGYYPETTYYKEEKNSVILADEDTAQRCAERLAKEYALEADSLRGPIARYLENQANEDGKLTRRDDCWYGWILWDVTHKTAY